MSDPRPRKSETDDELPPRDSRLDTEPAPGKGARVYERPERARSGTLLTWLVILVVLAVLLYLLFRYLI